MNFNEQELRHHLQDCIGQALDALGEKIHELSFFCTLEEEYAQRDIAA